MQVALTSRGAVITTKVVMTRCTLTLRLSLSTRVYPVTTPTRVVSPCPPACGRKPLPLSSHLQRWSPHPRHRAVNHLRLKSLLRPLVTTRQARKHTCAALRCRRDLKLLPTCSLRLLPCSHLLGRRLRLLWPTTHSRLPRRLRHLLQRGRLPWLAPLRSTRQLSRRERRPRQRLQPA